MADAAQSYDPRALESLLAFWADAGVDAMLADAPVDRLAAPPPRAPTPPSPTAAAPAPLRPAARVEPSAASDEARRLAAEAGDLAAVASAAARLPGAGRAVVWRGAVEPWAVVVGEAPSAEDEAAGEPFRDAPGRMVDALLAAAGLEGRVLYLNAVFWRAPGAASAADHAACRPLVERVIALARPRALLVMGAGAVKGFLAREEPILKARGRWGEWAPREAGSGGEGAALPALPTLSAAFAYAHPLSRRELWGDVVSLAARVDAPERPA